MKLVLHLSVLCASHSLSVTQPLGFSCLLFLHIALWETNRFRLIERSCFHHRFLSDRLQWFCSPHITKEEFWKSWSKKFSVIMTSFREIQKSTLMSIFEWKSGWRWQGASVLIKLLPACTVRKHRSSYSYQLNANGKLIVHFTAIRENNTDRYLTALKF